MDDIHVNVVRKQRETVGYVVVDDRLCRFVPAQVAV